MDKLPIAAGGLYSRQMVTIPTARIPCGPDIAHLGGALLFLAGALVSVATWVSAQSVALTDAVTLVADGEAVLVQRAQ